MNPNTIIIDQKDNVAIALKDISEGETICLPNGDKFPALTRIAFSHKVVLKDLSEGDDIIKYGEAIAQVNQDVKKGEWIHVHNLNVMEDS